jgi:hypothetical protein
MSRKNRKQARKNRRRRCLKKAAVAAVQNDPLGVDTSNFEAAVLQMLDNVRTGRTREAVRAEIAAFENRLLRS